jgi:transaldolase/glucose-6-phosphate isomerase
LKPFEKLHSLGQSIWYDNIQRSLLENGQLKGMIERGEIKGVTSNPSIFQNAIAKTTDYNFALQPMAWAGLSAEEIFWELAVKDIQDAADLFLPIYHTNNKMDGFVSLEVSPFFAKDTQKTVEQARQLWKKVNRPNLMIKIPATVEGLPAIRAAIADGINVNVTLIFSIVRYKEVIEAYLSGLEDRLRAGGSIEGIASVASFFVSRVDSKVDGALNALVESSKVKAADNSDLLGKAAIANAKLAFQEFKSEFSAERFGRLQQKGAQVQRPLWASTSTKNPNYRDVIYVEELIGPQTVNTMPPATLAAFLDHGKAEILIEKDIQAARASLAALEKLGIHMDVVTRELEDEGVKAFADAFTALIASVEERRLIQANALGGLVSAVKARVGKLEKDQFVERLHAHDPSLWTTNQKGQEEIRIRMDWTQAPWQSVELLAQLQTLLSECRAAGFTHALLLGMGGSSLAPEVLRLINGLTEYKGFMGLDLGVLDSTNPDEVTLARQKYPIATTLYIVASKSGTTGEINAFFQYFWQEVKAQFGDSAGSRFIAITDPATKLDLLARERGFWKVFNANPYVGGRNSALTAFGLVPAALVGVDVSDFLTNIQATAKTCLAGYQANANPGVVLGAVLAEATLAGRDKLTVATDPDWSSFGNWLEQLVAESSGKNDKGIVPVSNEPQVSPDRYGPDRLFVYLRKNGSADAFCSQLSQRNHPVLVLDVNSTADLGRQFYIWEIATATACSILGVNSFDQPDVQDAKTRTLAGIAAFKQTGKLETGTSILKLPDAEAFTNQALDLKGIGSMDALIDKYLTAVLNKTDYVAINAFLPRTLAMENLMQQLRKAIVEKFGNAVTLGFGPRFLHSTGQLHKGGPNSGVFIEFTADPKHELAIPEEGISFGTFSMAQALGDYQALEAKGRRLLRIHLHKPAG